MVAKKKPAVKKPKEKKLSALAKEFKAAKPKTSSKK